MRRTLYQNSKSNYASKFHLATNFNLTTDLSMKYNIVSKACNFREQLIKLRGNYNVVKRHQASL